MYPYWHSILDTFPSLSIPQTVIDTTTQIINLTLAFLLEPWRHIHGTLPADLDDAKYRMYAITHQLPVYFTRLYDGILEGWTIFTSKQDSGDLWLGIKDMFTENLGGEIWEWMQDRLKWIMWGWGTGVGCVTVLGLIVYWIRPDLFEPEPEAEIQADPTHLALLDPPIPRESRLSKAKTGSEFDSTSTSRTNTTTSTITTSTASGSSESDAQNQYNDRPNISKTPPHSILAQFICPNRSTWPAYYLQAFHRAEQSALQQNTIVGGHVDAPPSSGTRGNKDGCVGKIVLDKKKVKKDLKDGIIGYREGVMGLGNWQGIKWK